MAGAVVLVTGGSRPLARRYLLHQTGVTAGPLPLQGDFQGAYALPLPLISITWLGAPFIAPLGMEGFPKVPVWRYPLGLDEPKLWPNLLWNFDVCPQTVSLEQFRAFDN